MRNIKKYLRDFAGELVLVREQLQQVENRMKEDIPLDSWLALRRNRDLLLSKVDLLKFKINNAREGKNPWGEELKELKTTSI